MRLNTGFLLFSISMVVVMGLSCAYSGGECADTALRRR